MRKCANIQSYMRRPLVIYDFAPDPFLISLNMRKIFFYFLTVYETITQETMQLGYGYNTTTKQAIRYCKDLQIHTSGQSEESRRNLRVQTLKQDLLTRRKTVFCSLKGQGSCKLGKQYCRIKQGNKALQFIHLPAPSQLSAESAFSNS